jgi:hypothetical protein
LIGSNRAAQRDEVITAIHKALFDRIARVADQHGVFIATMGTDGDRANVGVRPGTLAPGAVEAMKAVAQSMGFKLTVREYVAKA